MRFSLLSLVAFTALSRAGTDSSLQGGQPSTRGANTLYFITNDPQGNHVVAANVDSNGDLTYAGATAAGGVGVHGLGGPGADASFSSGIVQVHQKKSLLATVNTLNNTVVLFEVNPIDPGRLKMLGKPVYSGGTSPNSLVFDGSGDRLCVLNTGSVNGMACFTVAQDGLHAQSDSVRHLGLNQTTPATGPFGTASQIAFTKDEKNLIAAVKGTMTAPGFLAVWPLDKHGRPASNFVRVSTPSNAGRPFSLTPVNGADAFLSADFAVGFDIFDFSRGVDGVSKSPRTVGVPIAGQMAACWSAYSSALDSYYVVDVGTAAITEVKVDKSLKASVVSNFTVPPKSGPVDTLAVNVGQHSYLYTLLASNLQIGVWRLDGNKHPLQQTFLDLSVLRQHGVPLSPNLAQVLAIYSGKA
ncbi:hypothetical protein PENSPDRAFT_734595 [Peniophora sp. CONT]|nr:hypothetical protein PENSPDRAFT_734595 [Peniophora sp. CONT]